MQTYVLLAVLHEPQYKLYCSGDDEDLGLFALLEGLATSGAVRRLPRVMAGHGWLVGVGGIVCLMLVDCILAMSIGATSAGRWLTMLAEVCCPSAGDWSTVPDGVYPISAGFRSTGH